MSRTTEAMFTSSVFTGLDLPWKLRVTAPSDESNSWTMEADINKLKSSLNHARRRANPSIGGVEILLMHARRLCKHILRLS